MVSDKLTADSIFLAAVELQPDQRTAYLKEACGNDTELLARVERLLDAQSHVGSFLESPAPELGATVGRSVIEQPGTVIGPYKLLQQIGEGGMGVVFMAEQTEPVQRDGRAQDHQARHGHAAGDCPLRGRAASPGDDGPPQYRPGVRCGHYRNGSALLRDGARQRCADHEVLRSQKQLPPERLELFIDVCQAVQHAHQKGIIHRDLKPIERDGGRCTTTSRCPKIIDFGVAKAISHSSPKRRCSPSSVRWSARRCT